MMVAMEMASLMVRPNTSGGSDIIPLINLYTNVFSITIHYIHTYVRTTDIKTLYFLMLSLTCSFLIR